MVFTGLSILTGCSGNSTDTDVKMADAEDSDASVSAGEKEDDTESMFSENELSSDDVDSRSETPFESGLSIGTGDKESAGDDGWQQAYRSYLKENPAEDGEYAYALIHVDDDDIPELVIDTGYEAGGCRILTWHDGDLDVLQTSRLYFTYIDRENLLDNSDGHMGYYYDYVFEIENGKWREIFAGEYSGFEDEADPEYDEDRKRYICTDYSVDGKDTDAEGYYEALDKVYDEKKATEVNSYLTYDDLESFLDTGKILFETHRYELCVEDCTWEEAEKKCEEKGGYLASMTSDGEFDYVEDMIRSEDLTNICFYVGAKCDNNFSWHWTEPGILHNNCLSSWYYKHWLDYGPSYTDTLADGTVIDEEYAELMYRKSEDRFYLNDVTNDVISVYPSFKGKMGYICEYSE